jgi:hypothetical protein
VVLVIKVFLGLRVIKANLEEEVLLAKMVKKEITALTVLRAKKEKISLSTLKDRRVKRAKLVHQET